MVLLGLSQSTNGLAHSKEMFEHEENFLPLGPKSIHRSTEMAPVYIGWYPFGEIPNEGDTFLQHIVALDDA